MAEVCLRPLRNNPPIRRWGELPGAYTPDTENTKGPNLSRSALNTRENGKKVPSCFVG